MGKHEYPDSEEYPEIDDVYDDDFTELLLENDEITTKEAAFMHGYNDLETG